MPTPKIEKEPWTDDHTITLLQTTINLVLTHRPDIYATQGLQGVSDNGGNRINQKLQQMLKKFCAMYPGAEGLVEEQIKLLKESKAGGGIHGTPKKRKVKDEK
ncbi:hypothetical protein I302_105982 [Kwoniella bestiolae CBS 10118]|uniref:Uncharacterized protein n=1 Tax=Kwoniella bestiolae CBS 10118 TaxID=1296100 RepID=A0A1B9G2N8_9TREE|nr:hypothetical protein I302_05106 [Kwoniella bestiolae CBS 10118]OCF25292.1 hypothetical protein I302_05106 [Kwoniella bestiolae CBS 10118]